MIRLTHAWGLKLKLKLKLELELKLELKLKRLRGLLSYIPRIPLASATISATAGILPTVEPFSNPGWAF